MLDRHKVRNRISNVRNKITEEFSSVFVNIVKALNLQPVDVKDDVVIENNTLYVPNNYIVLVDSFEVKVEDDDGSEYTTDVSGWILKDGKIVLPIIPFDYDDIVELKVIMFEFPYLVNILINNNRGFGPALYYA